MPFTPGFYDNLDINEYHADPSFSNSWFKHLAKNPRKYKTERQKIQKSKPHFDLGTAGHAAILQRESYYDHVSVAPNRVLAKDGHRKGNKYKEWAAEQKAKNKTILTQDQANQVRGMYQSVYEHPDHSQARSTLTLKDNLIEQSIFFNDPEFGFPCRVRPDFRNPKYRFAGDLKTCRDASKEAFRRDAAKLSYDRQAFFYLRGINAVQDLHYSTWIIICVEVDPPHCVAVYRLMPESIERGREKGEPLLQLYSDCLGSGNFHGYPDSIQDLDLLW